jgi:hypothetical protein
VEVEARGGRGEGERWDKEEGAKGEANMRSLSLPLEQQVVESKGEKFPTTLVSEQRLTSLFLLSDELHSTTPALATTLLSQLSARPVQK